MRGDAMEKKRLLVTASTFPRWEGDTEPRFVLDLCKHLGEWFDVTVLVPYAPGSKEGEILEGVTVIRYHYFPIHKWETLCYPGAIVARIKEKKARGLLVPFLVLTLYFQLMKRLPDYDIVHAHWIIPQGIIQSFFKKPYVVTGHGSDVHSLNVGFIRKLKIRALQKAKHVTVVSDHLKRKIEELDPGLQPSVISMGVNISWFGKQYFVREYFGQDGRKVVLFVGRLVKEKGITYLIEAMRQIDALLVIVGEGPVKAELEKEASEKNVETLFLGAKTHEELKTIYASADIFVMPSITAQNGGKEGFGLVALEAMASGLAVVASDSGGISQLIEDGVNGFLCEERNSQELAKKIKILLTDQKMADKMSQGALDIAARYDYHVLAERFMEVMQ